MVATLNFIDVLGESGVKGDKSSAPKLRPFPNLAANEAGDCRSFQESGYSILLQWKPDIK